MEIIVAYRAIPSAPGWSTGEVLALELEALGHTVHRHATTWGAGWSSKAPGKADALIYCECNDDDPQYRDLGDLGCPRVLWVFDDELYTDRAERFARDMRFGGIAAANWVRRERWSALGYLTRYVPYGITREAAARSGREKTIDVLMIGTSFPVRAALVRYLEEQGIHVETREGLPHAEYLDTLASAKIALHCYSSGGRGLHVARVYDALGVGTQLLAEAQEGLEELGVWTFRDHEDCASIIRERLHAATDSGASARHRALAKHAMAHRAATLLELIAEVRRVEANKAVHEVAKAAAVDALQYGEGEAHRKPRISLVHASARHATPANPARDAWLKAASGAAEIEYVLSTDAPEAGGEVPHVWGPNRGSVEAWNRGAAVTTGDVLIQMSDDVVPEDGWDASILDAIGDLTNPVVLWCRDGLQARCVTVAVMTRPRYKAQGCLLWPEYVSMWSDNDLTAWAARDGVLQRAEHIELTHQWGGADGDDVYRKQNSGESHRLGLDVFERRKKAMGRWNG